MNIRYFKLITGQNVIANLKESELSDYYLVGKPVVVGFNEKQDLVFAPFDLFSKADNDVQLTKAAVIFSSEPQEQLANAYRENFGDGLVLPNKGKLII